MTDTEKLVRLKMGLFYSDIVRDVFDSKKLQIEKIGNCASVTCASFAKENPKIDKSSFSPDIKEAFTPNPVMDITKELWSKSEELERVLQLLQINEVYGTNIPAEVASLLDLFLKRYCSQDNIVKELIPLFPIIDDSDVKLSIKKEFPTKNDYEKNYIQFFNSSIALSTIKGKMVNDPISIAMPNLEKFFKDFLYNFMLVSEIKEIYQ